LAGEAPGSGFAAHPEAVAAVSEAVLISEEAAPMLALISVVVPMLAPLLGVPQTSEA
jgi:hypothetical protein